MKWLTALLFGAILGVLLPTVIDGQSGVWMRSLDGWGTVRPSDRRLAVLDPAVPGAAIGVPDVLQLAQPLSSALPDRVPLIRVTAMPADTNPMAACSAAG